MDVVDDEREAELRWLIGYLEAERGVVGHASSEEPERLWPHLRALMNVREPRPASDEFYARQDRLLRVMAEEKGVPRSCRAVTSTGTSRSGVATSPPSRWMPSSTRPTASFWAAGYPVITA